MFGGDYYWDFTPAIFQGYSELPGYLVRVHTAYQHLPTKWHMIQCLQYIELFLASSRRMRMSDHTCTI